MKKKRTFKKYSYRGVDLDQLLDMSYEQLMGLMGSRARRKFSRGLKRKPLAFMKRFVLKEMAIILCVILMFATKGCISNTH